MSQFEQQVEKDIQNFLKLYDSNKDGEITKAEMVKYFTDKQNRNPNRLTERIFAIYDKDKNGIITTEEIRGNSIKMKTEMVDTSGDGFISFEELVEDFKKQKADEPELLAGFFFESLDRNNDKKISRGELRRYFEASHTKPQQ
ncbi:hypothetical protein CYY_007597 [Polysphondylium violaceum]|uniref:EF-hand domain-containing protein n=1 Tax=Polysphondylium violaceum TaxID=133409 RepID=A0A8J4PQK4_9MYCE|nr:hypothetical protein CYY_007597 [Polysphondylium violaceum]